MSIFQAVFLGAVQGLTEVLPISSSGHLVLMPWLFNFPDPGLSFDVALHVGTLVAIVAYFRKDWAGIVKGFISSFGGAKNLQQKLPYYLLLASVPGAMAGVLLNDQAETIFRSPLLIAVTTFFFGLVLLYAEKVGGKKDLNDINAKKSFLTGLSQAIAIIPGVSRSGITISAGMFQGFTREAAAKFSFLISAPIIFGAALVEIPKIPVSEYVSSYFIAGLVSSIVFSFLAVRFLMNFLRSHKLNIFAYYRFGLAGLILLFYFMRL